MQEVFIKVIFALSIIINVILSLRYVGSKLIVVYKKRKIRRERRFKRVIHGIVHKYLESIANSK